VGAAAEALAGSAGAKARRPLELQAAKCALLHGEPAAGALGLAAAAARLRQAGGPAMLHLRALNANLAPVFQVRRGLGVRDGVCSRRAGGAPGQLFTRLCQGSSGWGALCARGLACSPRICMRRI
jgi:hypothetical protein